MREHYSARQGGLRGHTGALQYHRDIFEDNGFLPSGGTSTYHSPRPGPAIVDEFGSMWRQADEYSDSPINTYQDGLHPNNMQEYSESMIYRRMPTPNYFEQNQKHARRMVSNSYSRSPSPPKRRKAAKKENKRSKLEKPLSELTRHLEHIPIKNTEAWVNRSLEERRKEVGNDGFIKRPSNSFILYRSAFADRCREYEKSNNHQDISSMAGASWAIESSAVRKQYEDWAKKERENHQAAFPDYKFQPQTQEAKARKRKEKFDEEPFEESDPEDPTYYGRRGTTPASARSARPKKVRRDFRESSYTPSLGSEGEWGSPQAYPSALHESAYFHGAMPGKPIPTALPRSGPGGGYFQTASYPNASYSNLGHIEDISYHTSDAPDTLYGSQIPAGLPGASHEELMADTSLDNGHLTFTAPTLDPDLLAFDHTLQSQTEDQAAVAAVGGFHANDYISSDQVEFGGEAGLSDGIEKWDHFDE
ncbi:uncharacterized protein KY384_002122 [Bacidia gigantensis]|uniref:uncharacterized protein n=1 Tax=Bacidia gigantensis TaxID=2732470 RepID=UPI001D039026|nr:uncharacterized protein KY384_002122 [Bacidia gigantensis]KAG8533339.1 hypothetical protein KY384_002122 [Bacidia gigantensis]